MHTLTLPIMLLLSSFCSLSYADRYNSMTDANSPPTSFDDDPATSANVYQAEPIEPPPQVQKNSMDNMPDELPENTEEQSGDVGEIPSQPS